MLYATHLSTTSSHKNIKLHLAAIQHFATLAGYTPSPQPRLYMLIRAIKRTQGKKFQKPRRAPITVTSLTTIYTFLATSQIPIHDKRMLWAATTTAFFGFLRSSEFVSSTTKSFNPDTTLLHTDITVSHDCVTLQNQTIKNRPLPTWLCVIKLYNNQLMHMPSTSTSGIHQHTTTTHPTVYLQQWIKPHQDANLTNSSN